ncbi:helix-turn-helix domain-containing protein [Candidatus Methylobacter oryzae]|uniref:Helix-turn-helix domain-containing protein n=1 Tax=Candidatus Methylobacter oryzae TaxID=2497749 RepID=A0ABY3CD01_9GAMM|nr:helix-turn-helix domain-containing protein [Candidatus Methylobacter oryzae]TRX00053.1 helix-turn-helix domain-containing protein [Candidatus Methylobacter oryzae]
MAAIKYKVNLTDEEKLQLEALVHKGKSAARSQTRARILLKAASGLHDKDIIQALDVSASLVAKTRQRCVEEGPEAALKEIPIKWRPCMRLSPPSKRELWHASWSSTTRPSTAAG